MVRPSGMTFGVQSLLANFMGAATQAASSLVGKLFEIHCWSKFGEAAQDILFVPQFYKATNARCLVVTNGFEILEIVLTVSLNSFYLKQLLFQNCVDSNITTQPDRYLMIVTSGGLNQQRTGVSVCYIVFFSHK